MSTAGETSDAQLLELLRISGTKSIAEMACETEVTATAVRQRLNRLMSQGLVERRAVRGGRGRPMHCYSLSEKARRQAGANFADLALVLWNEIRGVQDLEVRRGLLQRISSAMAAGYAGKIGGQTLGERMHGVRNLFEERQVPFAVDETGQLPVLTALDCPYPVLAEQDRGICAVEKMLFSQLLKQDVRLSQCRLDGHNCCQFEAN